RRRINPCSLSTTRMIARRRKNETTSGLRSTSRWNSSWRNSSNSPSVTTPASALRAWSPINRPSSPKNSRGPSILPTRSSPKSSSTAPLAITYMVVPRSPRRNRASPARTRRDRATEANSAYSSSESSAIWVSAEAAFGSWIPRSRTGWAAALLPFIPPTPACGSIELSKVNGSQRVMPGEAASRARRGWTAARSGRDAAALELLLLGRALERDGGRLAALDDLGHRVEVAGTDLALVLDRGEALPRRLEFGLLELDERAHLPAGVTVGELEHRVVERVEAGQGDELEAVAHRRKLLLEAGDGGVVEVGLPVEARRAVVGQQLAGELRVDRLGERAGEGQVGLAGLAPDQVGVRRVGQAAADGLVDALAGLVEALDGALAGGEFAIVVVDVGGQQVGSLGIGAGDDQGWHAAHVGRQARGDQLLDRLAGRHQHLAAHVAALLGAGQLVLEMHPGGAGLDHALHQLERVEHPAEAGLGIGHDRLQEVDIVLALGVLDLVGAQQGV